MSSTIPDQVRAGVESALARGSTGDARVLGARGAGGGCIHHALALETDRGRFFLKWNRGEEGAAFGAEARGLEALSVAAGAAGRLRVPEVIGFTDSRADEPGWLLLEYLPPEAPDPGYGSRLGEGLAALHAGGKGGQFGWSEDNRIGSLPQPNPRADRWAEFWRKARLEVQLDAAFHEGGLQEGDRAWSHALLEAVDEALAPVEGEPPALLHGDLWSGNVHPGPDGTPVLVDPAVSLGHGEVDLAMMELFGGFHRETFEAYFDARPSPPGYAEVRRPLYQLYYLLVHIRLFGGGYARQTRAAAREVLQVLGR